MQTIGRILCIGFMAMTWTAQVMEPNAVDPGAGPGTALVWSQPPLEIDPNLDPNVQPVFCGWDEAARSTHTTGETRQWRMVADDFPCLGPLPITHIRWWGSYKAWQQAEPPVLQPSVWHIGFWMNTRSDLTPDQVYLERMVWGLEIPHGRVAFEPAGIKRFPQYLDTMCYRYDLTLEPNEWFHPADFQAQGEVFWISVTAIYPTDAEPKYQWGWQTRPQPWRQGAQQPAIIGDWPTPDMPALFPGRITPVTSALVCGTEQAYDLAFELLTGPDSVAWNQTFKDLRTWPYAEDHLSYGVDTGLGVVMGPEVFDDWQAVTTDPIVALSWYGSYPGQGYEACQCDNSSRPRRPDYFSLNLRTGTPGHPTAPGGRVWQYSAHDFDEVLVGLDRSPEGEPNEAVFRYTVRLPEGAWFQPSEPNAVYWLNVVAVYRDQTLEAITRPWGWTSRPHAFGSPAQSMESKGDGLHVDPLSSPNQQPIDMAFTLYTQPLESQP